MKKTLTVNLGGTVFNIDEDAYELLDKYLNNLRIHFNKEEGSQEILNDFEMRIAELFGERIRLGYSVINIDQVEEVIERMGKPEEIFDDEMKESEKAQESPETSAAAPKNTIKKRLFRNPDDKLLGGVLGGLAAYQGWDSTFVRIAFLVLLFLPLPYFYVYQGPLFVAYIIMWIIVPKARSATEKLQMRGEQITVENIGKTVTDGYEKNNEGSSNQQRNFMTSMLGCLMIPMLPCGCLVLLVGLPLLLIPCIVLFATVFGGGFAMIEALSNRMPMIPWNYLSEIPSAALNTGSICSLILLLLPLGALIYALLNYIFHFGPMNPIVKRSLVIIWLIAACINLFLAFRYGIPFSGDWVDSEIIKIGKWRVFR